MRALFIVPIRKMIQTFGVNTHIKNSTASYCKDTNFRNCNTTFPEEKKKAKE